MGGGNDGDARGVRGPETCGGLTCIRAIAPLFRIAACVPGPKNSISVVQAYVY